MSSLTFSEYQETSRQFAVYPNKGSNFTYPTLGLCGEAGEISEKIKKVIRDNHGVVDDGTRQTLEKELGDQLWYLGGLASELGLDLGEIAEKNIDKLSGRQQRGSLHGSGDDR